MTTGPMPSSIPKEPAPTWVSSRQHVLLGATPLRIHVTDTAAANGSISLLLDVSHGRGYGEVAFTGTREQLRELVTGIMREATTHGFAP
jgi:hypothetical protein